MAGADGDDGLAGFLRELPDGMVKITFDIEDQATAPLVKQLKQEGMDDTGGFAGTNAAEDEDILSGIFQGQADVCSGARLVPWPSCASRPVESPSHRRKAFLSSSLWDPRALMARREARFDPCQ